MRSSNPVVTSASVRILGGWKALVSSLTVEWTFWHIGEQKIGWSTQPSREKVLPRAKKSVDIPRRDG